VYLRVAPLGDYTQKLTKLLCNLYVRPTSGEWVQVMRGLFRSRDKDGTHTIQAATAKNPMLHVNFMAVCVTEAELLLIKVLHCGNRGFQRYLLP